MIIDIPQVTIDKANMYIGKSEDLRHAYVKHLYIRYKGQFDNLFNICFLNSDSAKSNYFISILSTIKDIRLSKNEIVELIIGLKFLMRPMNL